MNTLGPYDSKRSFHSTPEPGANLAPTKRHGRRFVVQKHDASHLHYDFRLELNGVLKSWAVPKGPSLNPKDKRLAIMVEDHPYDYRTFEGIIPKGNYGAGTVMVWDEGTYYAMPSDEPSQVEAALKKGHLQVFLEGKKLKGAFDLIRLKTDDKSWLLVKKHDEFAEEDFSFDEKSVLTSRSLDQIKGGKPGKKDSPMPHDITPMLCTLVEEPFDDKEWLFEIKWDGYRAIAELDDHKVRLYSRNQIAFNKLFPNIVEALKKIDGTAIFDGEVVLVDEEGKSHFQLLQNYQKKQSGTPIYYIFDLLYHNGVDLRSKPLVERKEKLKALLKQYEDEVLRYSDHVEKSGKKFFKEAAKRGLEGIIAKGQQSTYQQRRSKEWLKIKAGLRQEVVICGFTAPQRSRKHFGALVIGLYKKGKLTYAGNVGTGFSEALLKSLHAKLTPLIREDCPIEPKPKGLKSVTWVEPKLVCEVNFTEWTDEGSMRHPSFQGLRIDKDPKKVVMEKPKKVR
ncbi:MAG: non-homologous end-joining DNA ligase [Chlamydiales bacterium]|nr:non-homologous end-joining DNA ligase [Chlamydiales bacterium]